MSRLTKFYLGEAPDAVGRHIDEIWTWGDEDLEEVHDYIQWLFPTPTRSAYNPNAPALTDEDIVAFRANTLLQGRLRRSFLQFLRFLGLAAREDGKITAGESFAVRCPEVWAYANHNWLRVSRVLMSLRLLGLESEAQTFLAWLDAAYLDGAIGSGDVGSRAEAAVSHAHWILHARDTKR